MRYQAIFAAGTTRDVMETEGFARARREGLRPIEITRVTEHTVQWGRIAIADIDCEVRRNASTPGPATTGTVYATGAGAWIPVISPSAKRRRSGAL